MTHLFDTGLEQGLAVVAAVGLLWQVWIFLQALALLRAGHRRVTYGLGPLVVAVVALIALWVIQ